MQEYIKKLRYPLLIISGMQYRVRVFHSLGLSISTCSAFILSSCFRVGVACMLRYAHYSTQGKKSKHFMHFLLGLIDNFYCHVL
jgi:hypothetical protein